MESELTFHHDPYNPGTLPRLGCGIALSASSVRNCPMSPVESAIWYCLDADGGVRLQRHTLSPADNGPTDAVPEWQVSHNFGSNPKADFAKITDAANAIIEGGLSKHIMTETYGNPPSESFNQPSISLVG